MGWASGTTIASEIEEIILKYIPKEKQKEVVLKFLEVLTDQDWDCQNEVEIFDYIDQLELLEEDDFDYDEDKKDCENLVKKYKEQFGW